jgi:hypothetical protein
LLTFSCKKMTVQNPNLAIFVLLKSCFLRCEISEACSDHIMLPWRNCFPTFYAVRCGACRSEVNSMYGGKGLRERTVLEPLRHTWDAQPAIGFWRPDRLTQKPQARPDGQTFKCVKCS